MLSGQAIGLLVLAFGLSCAGTELYRRYALHREVLDHPSARSAHSAATPRGGGLALVLVFLGYLAVAWFLEATLVRPLGGLLPALLAGGGLVALVGAVDDHVDLPARWRFLVHLLAALLATLSLDSGPGPAAAPAWLAGGLVALALVWSLNLYNFMDGIDGIAGVEALSLTLGGALLLTLAGVGAEVAWLLLLLAAAAAGFLVWNWPPARIFMGDSASGFLGFSLAVIAAHTVIVHDFSLWAWLVLYAVFLVDASYTLLRRVVGGQRWYQAHASHAYQILARAAIRRARMPERSAERLRALAHRRVTLGVALVNLCWLLPLAWLTTRYPDRAWLITVLAYLPLAATAVRVGAGKQGH